MIPGTNRFKGHNSLRFVYSNGKTYRNQNLSIKVALNSRRKEYRIAVVVSKKVSKLAVTRNKIRRRIYETARLAQSQINQPFDIVVTVFNDSVAVMPSDELKISIHKLLTEASILSQKPTVQD